MATHKNIGIICAVAAVLALLLTAVLMFAAKQAPADEGVEMGYENLIFDNSVVHEIDIQMDDWESFIATCENEEYASCTVTVDGEVFEIAAIRAKGNTSLSTVSSLDSDRYSFKVEFDHYDSGSTYHGLDKLSLNNLIQDATYMKDYLTYQAMAAFGVDAPLCSYVYLTVNGEDWGLYLAVEGVEDSYLERNHGSDYGELYKPDSMDFGGGRGNGAGFDMEEFDFSALEGENAGESAEGGENTGASEGAGAGEDAASQGPRDDRAMPEGFDASSMPEGFDPSMMGGEMPEGFDPSVMGGGAMPQDAMPQGGMPQGEMPEGFDASSMGNGEAPEGFDPSGMFGGEESGAGGGAGGGFGFGGGMGGMFGMGSSDVKLQYLDDSESSYSNIFNSAKTNITDADKTRLIESLEQLSARENLEDVVNVDQVMRYFVVHNFVVNSDSYTGAMVHNYYLYEEGGQLSMVPWDYNLAFGTFSGGDATSAVNDPIDTPLSAGTGDRPMFDWITSSEEYLALYHEYYAAFLQDVDLAAIAEETAQLIAPYVEKDPTAFYSYEEFQQGVATIVSFCELRAQSVAAQLDGVIATTDEGQAQDSSALVDASALTLSDMGSMAGTGMGEAGGARTKVRGGRM